MKIERLFPIKWFLGCRELSPSFCRRGDMLIIFIFLSLLQFPVLWQDLGWPDWNSRKYQRRDKKCVRRRTRRCNESELQFPFIPPYFSSKLAPSAIPRANYTYNSYFQLTIELWNYTSYHGSYFTTADNQNSIPHTLPSTSQPSNPKGRCWGWCHDGVLCPKVEFLKFIHHWRTSSKFEIKYCEYQINV